MAVKLAIIPVTPFQQNCSLLTQLWPLGDDVAFVPGHGPMSTFGDERRSNRYVSDAALADG